MALSRIGNTVDGACLFIKPSFKATIGAQCLEKSWKSWKLWKLEQLHGTVVRRYPEAPHLPLPSNVSEIFNIETSRFTPERARDIAAPVLLYGGRSASAATSSSGAFADQAKMHQLDSRVHSYDCFGALSLSGAMQTNVPKPFCAGTRATYLNMPGGQWSRDDKYLADVMKKSHFTVYQMRHIKRSAAFDGLVLNCSYSTATTKSDSGAKLPKIDPQTKRQRLKSLVKDYGKTVIIFHIAISLVSLGGFYSLVSSGLDVTPLVKMFSSSSEDKEQLVNKVMGQGSTFLVAYAVHKLFAPVRLSITIACSPIIVKYFRRKGILKSSTLGT